MAGDKRTLFSVAHLGLGLGPHLFVKVPRPGESEVTFRSSSQAATCYYQSKTHR